MKKTILYIIDSLERGGAEVMLVSTLKEVHENYNIVIVTLQSKNVFSKEELVCDKLFCLDMNHKTSIFSAVKKLQTIIKDHKVDILHSYLYWSVVVARLACPKNIPHVFSLATIMTTGIYEHKWYSGYTKLIDQLTYKKSHVIISPTHEVLADFDNSIGIKGKAEVLYNFVDDAFFENAIEYKIPGNKIRLVAVGNLKDVKNYQLIVDAFKILKSYNISVDIYGEGPDRNFLEKQIEEANLPVKLMGLHDKIYEILPLYDMFVMCSIVEGFGISAAEAMAIGLPLLLSDIKVLKEISHDNAIFFDPARPQSFADALIKIYNNEFDLCTMSQKGKVVAKENYTKEKYLQGLLKVYDEVII